jgi:hypothetical protein
MGYDEPVKYCDHCEEEVPAGVGHGGHIPRWCSVECRQYWIEEEEARAGIQDQDI